MPLLEVKKLDKKFGQHYALSDIAFDIAPGEVHALVGENGAGKSTFIKIITGVYAPDGGHIYWKGAETAIPDPKSARVLGINVVHQDRHLIPSFTGWENVYLGLEYPQRKFGMGIRWREMKRRAELLREELGISLDLRKTALQMSPPERTMLEILRAMMLDCRLLILDEPTAALTDQEAELLFQLIDRLTAQGTAILYVSHRMDEIFRIAHRVTVFRNGRNAGTARKEDTSKEEAIRMMTNTDSQALALRKKTVPEDAPSVLEVRSLATADGRVKQASLTVRQGEIVGLFGLAGSGRTELLEAIYGTRRIRQGEIHVAGRRVGNFSPRRSLDRGVVLIPEDRRGDALVMGMNIRENMTLPVLSRFSKGLKITKAKEQPEAARWMDFMKVKATGSEQPVHELSGGNQQKVVFAKALLSKPVLYLCDEPTQAVDVKTREDIHRMLREQSDQSCGVLFVSSDLQEVLAVSDRIYVLRDGEIAAELPGENTRAEQILQICYTHGKESEASHG